MGFVVLAPSLLTHDMTYDHDRRKLFDVFEIQTYSTLKNFPPRGAKIFHG